MSQPNLDHILAQLQAAQGDPQALTLATLNIVLEVRGPQLRPLIEAAAIPHWFDHHILSALLPEQTISADAFAALTALPMVEHFQGKGWNVHESTRLALRRWLAVEHPERLRQLSAHAAAHFQTQPDAEVETLYHRLLADPDSAAGHVGEACYQFRQTGRQAELDRLGLALAELLTLPNLPAAAEARACLHVAEIRAAYLNSEERKRLARRALALFRVQAVADGEAHAWCAVGDVESTSGQLTDAEHAYQQTKRILQSQLLTTQPDATRWLRDLAVAHSRLGDVCMAQGQLDAAAQAFVEDLAISARLVALDPANTGWLDGLAVAYRRLGDVCMDQGQLDAAAQACAEYLVISGKLVALDPANLNWQYGLAVISARLGQCHFYTGKPKAGLLLLKQAESQLSQLVRQSPDHAVWRTSLKDVHQMLRQFSRPPSKAKPKHR